MRDKVFNLPPPISPLQIIYPPSSHSYQSQLPRNITEIYSSRENEIDLNAGSDHPQLLTALATVLIQTNFKHHQSELDLLLSLCKNRQNEHLKKSGKWLTLGLFFLKSADAPSFCVSSKTSTMEGNQPLFSELSTAQMLTPAFHISICSAQLFITLHNTFNQIAPFYSE